MNIEKYIDILIPFFVSFSLIFIGIDEKYSSKEYQKKHLMTVYFVMTIIISYIVIIKGYENFFILILGLLITYLILSIFGAINVAYNIGQLEKRMTNLDLFFLKFFEWMFTIRSYMYLLYMIILPIAITSIKKIYLLQARVLFLEKNNIDQKTLRCLFFVLLIGTATFSIIYIINHLLHNVKDMFAFETFDQISSIFDEKLANFNMEYNIDKGKISGEIAKDNKKIIEFLAFVIYMEDKDLFDRVTLRFSPLAVKRRKNRIKLEKKKIKSGKEKIKSDKNKIKTPKYKITRRGYSTIPQQTFRRISLKEHAYTKATEKRRKIFIEYIYMPYFFKYYMTNKNKYIFSVNGNKIKYDNKMLKVDILKVYVEEVLKFPNDKTELLDIMSENSNQPSREQYEYYYKVFMNSKEKHKYIHDIKKNYYRYYKNSKNIILKRDS